MEKLLASVMTMAYLVMDHVGFIKYICVWGFWSGGGVSRERGNEKIYCLISPARLYVIKQNNEDHYIRITAHLGYRY